MSGGRVKGGVKGISRRVRREERGSGVDGRNGGGEGINCERRGGEEDSW